MSSKLAKVVGNEAAAKKLENAGYVRPSEIRKLSDLQLRAAGLTNDEVEVVRTALPKR